MRVTVDDLSKLWRDAAEMRRREDTSDAHAKADQLEDCAKDLQQVKFRHELVQDPETKRKWWKLL
jgi:hypothetical protein